MTVDLKYIYIYIAKILAIEHSKKVALPAIIIIIIKIIIINNNDSSNNNNNNNNNYNI